MHVGCLHEKVTTAMRYVSWHFSACSLKTTHWWTLGSDVRTSFLTAIVLCVDSAKANIFRCIYTWNTQVQLTDVHEDVHTRHYVRSAGDVF